ncbi:Non-reducing end alpha-L-arabinofuranosidase BoGH43B [Rhypophila decipiens]|uniref:Non-reducing end alpha-L-arabinofuranosidase BoGH43B n=1 Tax=Rhypophila decipiens TaxID=261697 RepID=A0AAN6YIG6_9PEZI|nr:Non-reducing end alpha-L-arabinofuranosidase BoGH43B [Rhypophila decipiens]
MLLVNSLLYLAAAACIPVALGQELKAVPSLPDNQNSTYHNPILPGFHPDPSCIFVPEHDDTFFCASSSFNAFPGIPIHASRDLQSWKLIGHVLNRREQLTRLAETNRSTSGIWAPALRYHEGTFWLVTTLVDDDRPQADSSRWDNIIFRAKNPYDPSSWSKAVHFNFTGYDTEPFWDVDGKVYITGAHAWQVGPGIQQAQVDLETGELLTPFQTIWNGTGGLAPEGPHIYHRKDNDTDEGYYYLLAAEGGTGLEHMVTMARSRSVSGPFESNPANPVLSNYNTTSYFQTVGHADLFQDRNGNWWGVALSTRSGPEYIHFPMVRETVMTPVRWSTATEFPVWSPIRGTMSGWPFPSPRQKDSIPGPGPYITEGDDFVSFSDNMTSLPMHFTHWRFPPVDVNTEESKITISAPEKPGTLRLDPSFLNLTAINGNYAGPKHDPTSLGSIIGGGQSFVGRRQQDTLFTFSVHMEFSPSSLEEEAGVSVFLTQNHHLDMGIVLLPRSNSTGSFPSTAKGAYGNGRGSNDSDVLVPHVRFRGISYVPVPEPVVLPLPVSWSVSSNTTGDRHAMKLSLEIKASNMTHYAFSVGETGRASSMQTVMVVSNEPVSWGFTGTILGVYCTSNGRLEGNTPAYFSNWRYIPQGQFRD